MSRAGSFLIAILIFSFFGLAAPISPNIHSTYPSTHISAGSDVHDCTPPGGRSLHVGRSMYQPHITQLIRKSIFSKIRSAFKKVAQVAKFGLEIASAAASVAAKVVNVIPGVGEGVGSTLKAISTGANAASNAIHVNLGSKLQTGLGILKTIRNPIKGVGGAVLNVLKREEGPWVV